MKHKETIQKVTQAILNLKVIAIAEETLRDIELDALNNIEKEIRRIK